MMKGFTGGFVTGAIMGATALMIACPIKEKKQKQMCKAKHQMFKTVGQAIDSLMDMF